MRHLRRFAVAAIVFILFASPVRAQGLGREWLERLSGPGPFDGFNYRFTLGRLDNPIRSLNLEPKQDGDAKTEAEQKAAEEKGLCRVCLDVEFSDLANYAEDRPQNGLITITGSQFLIMFPITALNMHGALEVGGGLGWAHFRGDTFDFKKSTVPVRAIVKPLRFIPALGRRKGGIFQIVFPLLIFPDAIRKEEFTKTNFSFQPDHFLSAEHAITVMIDFSSYIFNR